MVQMNGWCIVGNLLQDLICSPIMLLHDDAWQFVSMLHDRYKAGLVWWRIMDHHCPAPIWEHASWFLGCCCCFMVGSCCCRILVTWWIATVVGHAFPGFGKMLGPRTSINHFQPPIIWPCKPVMVLIGLPAGLKPMLLVDFMTWPYMCGRSCFDALLDI